MHISDLWRSIGGHAGCFVHGRDGGHGGYGHVHDWQQHEAECGFHGERVVRCESSTPPEGARGFLGRFWKPRFKAHTLTLSKAAFQIDSAAVRRAQASASMSASRFGCAMT